MSLLFNFILNKNNDHQKDSLIQNNSFNKPSINLLNFEFGKNLNAIRFVKIKNKGITKSIMKSIIASSFFNTNA